MLRSVFSKLCRPVPSWVFALYAMLTMSAAAGAAIGLYTGSVAIPASGSFTSSSTATVTMNGAVDLQKADAVDILHFGANCSAPQTYSKLAVNSAISVATVPGSFMVGVCNLANLWAYDINGNLGTLGDVRAGATLRSMLTGTQVDFMRLGNNCPGGNPLTFSNHSNAQVGTVAPSAWGNFCGTNWISAMDTGGDFAVRSTMQAADSTGGTVAFVPVVYNANGTSTAGGLHIDEGQATCSFSASTTCTFNVTFLGAAQFNSVLTEQCFANGPQQTPGTNMQTYTAQTIGITGTNFEGVSTTAITMAATVNWFCIGI